MDSCSANVIEVIGSRQGLGKEYGQHSTWFSKDTYAMTSRGGHSKTRYGSSRIIKMALGWWCIACCSPVYIGWGGCWSITVDEVKWETV